MSTHSTTPTNAPSSTRVGAWIGTPAHRIHAALQHRFRAAAGPDAGMSTVEYAVGTIAAAAFGAVLYTVVSGDSIPDALGGIIEQALNTSV